jgi:hypothetical protein
MAEINLSAAYIGVAILQAGTPESMEAVTDKWLDSHLGTEVIAMELQVTPAVTNAPLHMMITYKRERRVRRG